MLSLPGDSATAAHLSPPRDKRASGLPLMSDPTLFSLPRWPWPDFNSGPPSTTSPPDESTSATATNWWDEPPSYPPSSGRVKNDYRPLNVPNPDPVSKQHRYHPYGGRAQNDSTARWSGYQLSSGQQQQQPQPEPSYAMVDRTKMDPFQSENGTLSLPPLDRARPRAIAPPPAPAPPRMPYPGWGAPSTAPQLPAGQYRSPSWRSSASGPPGPAIAPSVAPRSELAAPTPTQPGAPEGQTPTEFVRVLQTWIQVAPAVIEEFPGPADQPKIRPVEGSIILSRQVALGQGTVSFALEYTERPRIPLAQLQLDIPGVKQAGKAMALPIVHRFALPDVVFLTEGDRTVATLHHRSSLGTTTWSHDKASDQAVACIKYQGRVWITGWHLCAIVKLRMECFGRRIINMNKFLEGIYSDLRTLRSNGGSVCEAPRSPFLSVLSAYDAVNTRKQQRVYTWSHVNHDRLFVAQLDRELDREMRGVETVSVAVAEPALSFPQRKPKDRSLLEQVGLVPRPDLSLYSPSLTQKQLESLVLCHQPCTN